MIRAWSWPERTVWLPHDSRRARRWYFGELVQIDGNHHDWLEEWAELAFLMVENTTGHAEPLMVPEKTFQTDFEELHKWTERYGVLAALYTDSKNINITDC